MGILNKFLRFLERHGRKTVLVDPAGNVMFNRYFVFYKEDPEDTRWIANLPNIFIHEFIRPYKPDGGVDHEHPWPTVSFMVSGSYTENLNGVDIVRKAGDVIKMDHNDVHTIVSVEPVTTTIFCHGFKRHPWFFKPKKCENVCETCAKNFGKCYLENKKFEYDEAATQFDKQEHQWRAPKWFDWTPDLEKKLERRKRATEKMAIKMPQSQEERVKLMIQHSKYMVDDSKVTKLEI